MTKKEKKIVKDAIECEGFEYCFRNYSSFPEVKDERFHQLREAFRKAAEDLERYVEG